MTDEAVSDLPFRPKLGALKIALIGMAGYLLGSFFPAGYVRYFIQSKLFPETLAYQPQSFDRSKLSGAVSVLPSELTDTLDQNPSLFRQKFLDKPVIVSGTVKFFIDGALGSDGLTLTLDTGDGFGDTGIFMSFDDPKADGVVALRKGGPVTATCMTTGMTTDSVHLGHCEVTK